MDFLKRNIKRVATDAAGYFLILAGIATGWLPGPGGIPLIVAGLGLLSINNAWAKRLRVWVLGVSSNLIHTLFPKNPWIEWGYDILVAILLALTVFFAVRHASILEMSFGVTTFALAVLVALANRGRLYRLRGKQRP